MTLNDAEVIREAIRTRITEVRVAIPAQVEAYDATAQTVDVKIVVKDVHTDADGNKLVESLPVLAGVPVLWPRGGGFFATMPIQRGDFVQLLVNDRDINGWRTRGRESEPDDLRTHDLSYAVAIPAGYPDTAPLADASATDLVIGKDGSGPLLTMKSTGEILIGRNATAAAARVGDAVQVTIPPGSFLTAASGGVLNPAPVTVNGQITAGSSSVKVV